MRAAGQWEPMLTTVPALRPTQPAAQSLALWSPRIWWDSPPLSCPPSLHCPIPMSSHNTSNHDCHPGAESSWWDVSPRVKFPNTQRGPSTGPHHLSADMQWSLPWRPCLCKPRLTHLLQSGNPTRGTC